MPVMLFWKQDLTLLLTAKAAIRR